MKSIKILGLILLLGAFGLFNVLFFLGEFKVSDKGLSQFIESKRIKSEVFIKDAQTLINQSFDNHVCNFSGGHAFVCQQRACIRFKSLLNIAGLMVSC